MYFNGKGVLKDYKAAVKWFRLSAEQGNHVAQYNLGWVYSKGKGVGQDNVYAYMWYSISALSGYKDAIHNREIVKNRMSSSQIAEAMKLSQNCVKMKYRAC